ncbi:hypothetical protein BJX70DRAFT_375835 [Aspergillus crustosus]
MVLYDFKVILGPKAGKRTSLRLHETPSTFLLNGLGVTRSPEIFTPTRHYECPDHIYKTFQAYNTLRESQKELHFVEDYWSHGVMNWKLQQLLMYCLSTERLEFEGRSHESPTLPPADLAALPRPLRHAGSPHIYIGFQDTQTKRDYELEMTFASGVVFGDERWNIGLSIHYKRPEYVRHESKDCVLGMRAVQQARKECDGEESVDMYGIVTSGDIIQFHKLKDNGELQSSPVLYLTSDYSDPEKPRQILSTVWSYLREIIHLVQAKAPPPLVKFDGAGSRLPRPRRMFEIEPCWMRGRWRLAPDGTPIERADEQAGHETRRMMWWAVDPEVKGDIEVSPNVDDEVETSELESGDESFETVQDESNCSDADFIWV